MGEGTTHSFISGFFGILAKPLPWIALVVAGLGIFLAYAIYSAKWLSAEKIGAMFKPLYTLFYNKYYLDVLYEDIIVRKFLMGGVFRLAQLFDTYVIDGIVNLFGKGTVTGGRAVRHWETGQLQLYGLFIGIGVVAIVIVVYIFG